MPLRSASSPWLGEERGADVAWLPACFCLVCCEFCLCCDCIDQNVMMRMDTALCSLPFPDTTEERDWTWPWSDLSRATVDKVSDESKTPNLSSPDKHMSWLRQFCTSHFIYYFLYERIFVCDTLCFVTLGNAVRRPAQNWEKTPGTFDRLERGDVLFSNSRASLLRVPLCY